MPALFTKFSPLIIPLEGDTATRVSDDRGGLTKYGISQSSYPNVDIANLTFRGACQIYENDWWDHYGLGRIDSQLIANKLMSIMINAGSETAIRLLQIASNACGISTTIDGELGINTVFAINHCPSGWLLDRFKLEVCGHYSNIVLHNESQLKFLDGWIRRALA